MALPTWLPSALALFWLAALFGLWWLIEGLGVNRRQGVGLAWLLFFVGWLLFEPQRHLGHWAVFVGVAGWNVSLHRLRRLPEGSGPRFDLWAPPVVILLALSVNIARSL